MSFRGCPRGAAYETRKWNPEQKARIVPEGLRGPSVGEPCHEHGMSQAQHCQW
ncbi:transposase [Fundidesulfovibrio soli]|uniref:transposase n=1 Tax=Fundidesulfovibrio soli TaxID=2922716 RepID=UPI003AFB2A7A